jgi:hypothetical protein
MKKSLFILFILISNISFSQGSWQLVNGKQRFIGSLGVPTKDTTTGTIADSSQIVIRPLDSSLWFKYKSIWQRIGGTATPTTNKIASIYIPDGSTYNINKDTTTYVFSYSNSTGDGYINLPTNPVNGETYNISRDISFSSDNLIVYSFYDIQSLNGEFPSNSFPLTNGMKLTLVFDETTSSWVVINGFPNIGDGLILSDGILSNPNTGTVNSVGISSTDLSVANSPVTTNGDIYLELKNVNSNVGTFGTSIKVPTITVNSKGLVTAASDTNIPIATNLVTGLLTNTDWNIFNDKQSNSKWRYYKYQYWGFYYFK